MATIPTLTADCSRCAALCCVALPFDAGDDFAIDKPARTPCPNLAPDCTCAIHDRLESAGFSGCARYDCLGAGQRVTEVLFQGRSWRDDPSLLAPMAESFAALRQVHRDLELLLAARSLPLPHAPATELTALIDAHAPDDGWTGDSVTAFAASGISPRVKTFLRGLRAYL